ncbi:protein tyrosine phosphatase [Hymenobacter rubripertinctus]|uniref:Protein tyrosine phosphatase n=1 Tax=Hymenobacter rubripertinctus TaxID=2029981 RepID=A0A418R112_9BACT|nr:protein tyrosine phosphatase [Hymenobacter rubripertinctus]RIY11075.1 protein tyrosine phosphatase [Hymenobacter rubripertinctus]
MPDSTPTCQARSAGTEPGARVRVTAGHLGWAEVLFVMERHHADILRQKFPQELAGKRIINLRIPDKFHFMDHILQDLLRERLREHLGEDVDVP